METLESIPSNSRTTWRYSVVCELLGMVSSVSDLN